MYYSFHLDESNECLNDPLNYFNLSNHFNISHITNVLKITNSSSIKKINETKEKFIQSRLNFTKINGKITFESDHRSYKIYSILIGSIFLFNIFIIALYLIILSYELVNLKGEIMILTILLISDILSVIFNIINFITINKLSTSIKIFHYKIKDLFQLEIPKVILNEYDSFSNSQTAISFNIISSSLFIVLNISCCRCRLRDRRTIY